MPDVYGPFTSATWGQGPWYRSMGPLLPSGVAGPPAATAATGELGLTTAGLVGSLALGRGFVRGAGYERTGTAFSYTHPANTNPTQARIDRYVLRRDLTAMTVVPAVLQGTPAATPAAVALTQVEDGIWELGLFQVTVPAASGTVLTVVDERQYLPQLRDRSGGLERWTGTAWEDVGPSDWVILVASTTSYTTSLATGGFASVAGYSGLSVTVPAGRILELEFTAPKLNSAAGQQSSLRLKVDSAILDAIEQTSSASLTTKPTLLGSVVGTGAAVTIDVEGWSPSGGGLQASTSRGPRLRYRIV